MSSVENRNKCQEQGGNEGTVEVIPPYAPMIENFDNPDTHPDLELAVTGMEKPLQLHKCTITHASKRLHEILRERKDMRLECPCDINDEVDREVLVKALRFCYGETQNVDTKNGECCAMIAMLTRLQVTCLDETVKTLINFAVSEAKRKMEVGVELLKACTRYDECCGLSALSLDKKLAAIVLTKDNMYEHYKEIVDDCLMVLPPEYLTLAEYGEPHTRCSEFCLRAKYVRYHSKEMSQEEKQALVTKCDWSTLNSQELRELRLADIIDKDKLLEAYEKALEYSEIENERVNKIARRVEKGMEERVAELEKEKEKESERAKKAETERDRYAKEAEEYQRRAEKAKMEKEKYWNHAETLEIFMRGSRLYKRHYQNE